MSNRNRQPNDKSIDLEDLPAPVVELSADEAEQVQGGTTFTIMQDGTVNKAKTADKAFKAMDTYIRS